MIFPQTNSAPDVNVAIIRIANENNKDIDAMGYEVDRLNNQQKELTARFESQQRRWKNYKISFEAINYQYQSLLNGVDEDWAASLLPGFIGK